MNYKKETTCMFTGNRNIMRIENEKSGTGQTVRIARKNGHDIVNIANGGLGNA